MTQTIEQTATQPTVDDVMAQILNELSGSLGVMTSALGVRTGLWAALAGAGPVTPAELAQRTGVAEALAREWLRSQAAAGYLDYDPAAGLFTLSDAVAAAMLGPGAAMIDACMNMFSSMGGGFAEFTEAFRNGGGYGWDRRTEEYWHGSDLLTRAVLPPELIGAILDDLGTELAAGGSVADIGCGYGTPTVAVANHFPATRVLGIDYHDVSVAHARAAAATAGVSDRVRFEVSSATDLPGSGYDLITFFDSLHDLGDPVGALTHARHALAANGAVLLVELMAADDVQDNFNPAGRMLYAVSTLICTPNAVSQHVSGNVAPLGTLVGEHGLREVAAAAGFTRVRRVPVDCAMNLVLELRV